MRYSGGGMAKGPEQLGRILEKVCSKIEKQKKEKEEILKVLNGLSTVLGKKLVSHIKPYRIYRKRLIIKVAAPVYLQEILFKKEKIIEAVNKTFGKELVKDVNFKVGESERFLK